jgi:hypothetical protein
MDEVTARAVLVPTSEVSDGVTTSIPRSELDEVLDANEMPIELVLDVARVSNSETSDTRTVAVSWEREQLEQLLREAQGDEVILTFDRESLRRAIEDEVEAHGFREVALALAIAGTAAGGAAATASAEPGPLLGTAAPTSQSVSPDDRAFSRTAAPTLSPDDRAVPRGGPVEAPTPGVSPDDRAVPRMTPTAEPTLSPDDRAFPRGTPVDVPATGTVSDPGISWSPTPAETGVLAGVIALAIAGAYFIVGGRRRPRIRPV